MMVTVIMSVESDVGGDEDEKKVLSIRQCLLVKTSPNLFLLGKSSCLLGKTSPNLFQNHCFPNYQTFPKQWNVNIMVNDK